MSSGDTRGSYLVLGFIPDDDPKMTGRPETPWGVHTPLRSDGYYAGLTDMAFGVAQLWRSNLMHPRERVVVVKIVDAGGGDPGCDASDFGRSADADDNSIRF